MSKSCPLYQTAIYMDCQECSSKPCLNHYRNIVIGIDQSYENTGISIAADGVLKKVKSVHLSKYNSNSKKRKVLAKKINEILQSIIPKADNIICVIERIRLRSQGFINIDYIKSIGALNSVIVDACNTYGIEVYSVDTRCWKAQVIGTSKPEPNKYGVPEEKWPTVRWVINKGFESSILDKVEGKKVKGTFMKNNVKYMYNNDAADSAGIAMFWFIGDHEKLKLEK